MLTVVGVTSVAVAAMLLVRRRAPLGSVFEDGDRASGVFGVLATGFSVLLGLIVFLAFSSYDQSRTGAESEALLLAQQYETAQFMPAASAPGWATTSSATPARWSSRSGRRCRAGTAGASRNPWSLAMFRTLETIDPKTAAEQSAYDRWLDQRATASRRATTGSTAPSA